MALISITRRREDSGTAVEKQRVYCTCGNELIVLSRISARNAHLEARALLHRGIQTYPWCVYRRNQYKIDIVNYYRIALHSPLAHEACVPGPPVAKP
jgi:hypothetical protein